MTTFSDITTLTVGISLTLLSSASMADTLVAANASLNNLQFQVIDLNPFDNVAPSITFTDTNHDSASFVQNGFGKDQTTVSDSGSIHTLDNLSTGAATAQSGAYAWGNLFSNISTKGFQLQNGQFIASENFATGFNLSANSLLILSGDIMGSVYADTLANSGATSHASLSLYGITLPNNGGQQFASINRDWSLYGTSSSFEHFAISFANGTPTAINGTLYSEVYSTGYTQATAVPEPESWAMMLGGLAALGVVARRRQRQKAQ